MERFEWDPKKNERNLQEHGIDFRDAATIFEGPTIVQRSDRNNEVRWLAIGQMKDREIAVAFTMRGPRRRLISARRARDYEREGYRAFVERRAR